MGNRILYSCVKNGNLKLSKQVQETRVRLVRRPMRKQHRISELEYVIGEFWRFLPARAGQTNGSVGCTQTRVDTDDFSACDYVLRTSLDEGTGKILIGESLQLPRRFHAE